MKTESKRIDALDGLRGWAVALVFAVHFSGAFGIYRRHFSSPDVTDFLALDVPGKLLYWLFYSHYGVYVFFVISGFVISRSFASMRTVADYGAFLGHRVLRVYPAFLVALCAAILVLVLQGGGHAVTLKVLLQNLVFLNGVFGLQVPAINGVTWSLFFEFVFYIVFPLLFLLALQAAHPRRMAPLLWLLAILASAVASYAEWFLFLPFLAGAWAGLQSESALDRIAARCPDWALSSAYVATTTTACVFLLLPRRVPGGGLSWSPAAPVFVLVLSIVVTLIIIRACHGRGFLHRLLTTRPLLALGRISYSFFLLHAIVLYAVMPVTAPYFSGTLWSFAALALAVLLPTWILATLLYRFAEQPYFAFRSRQAGSVQPLAVLERRP